MFILACYLPMISPSITGKSRLSAACAYPCWTKCLKLESALVDDKYVVMAFSTENHLSLMTLVDVKSFVGDPSALCSFVKMTLSLLYALSILLLQLFFALFKSFSVEFLIAFGFVLFLLISTFDMPIPLMVFATRFNAYI